MADKIIIKASIQQEKAKVWDHYTTPEHIVNWNFASHDWCCPKAENDMKLGGIYKARMEAKDGSFGFDFEAKYTAINEGNSFSYQLTDGRSVDLEMIQGSNETLVQMSFDPEKVNSIEMQKQGWQAILDNFKSYSESLDT